MSSDFIIFGFQHLTALGIIFLLSTTIPQLVKRYASDGFEFKFRMLLAILIWGQEIALNIYRATHGHWDIRTSLVLHLCGMSIVLLPFMLYKKNYFLYELTYFWGLAGASQALLTPNITDGFPHFYFFQMFTSHGLIVFTVVYATVVFGFRPTLQSGIKTFKITMALMFPIGLLNWILGSNYFFISHKPPTASVLDFMGPWPYYLIGMIAMGMLMFTLVYLPIPFLKKAREK